MYSCNDRVSYSRIDKDGLLGVSNVVDALQDCCLFHSEDVGHSALKLREKNRAWLVNSWHVVFKRRPKMGEEFVVHTWPYRVKGIFGFRNFLMETPDKEVLAFADSKWFYFDSSTGKPAKIDQDEIDAYPTSPAYDMDYSSRKVPYPEKLLLRQKIEVCQNYLDTNHHVNNGQYVRLAVNVLPIDYEVSELRAEFRLAAKMGDILYIHTAEENGYFYVVFTDEEETPYFIGEFSTMVPT
ncbi:MAG: acyl-[acyl-carrier-protein] thioesterase [Lachnospiraceae bacterium]|nr:acyl-[acyl-carrier-protein] thioesterase [Lachnospiraceae bacterium]